MSSVSQFLPRPTMSSDDNKTDPKPEDPDLLSHLDYRGIFWLTIGSLVIPIYVVACVLSIIKALHDRKLIKARILARQLEQPPPPAPSTPLDIIAKEVRKNRWHKRQSSMTLVKIQSLLNANSNCYDDRRLGSGKADRSPELVAGEPYQDVDDDDDDDDDDISRSSGAGDVRRGEGYGAGDDGSCEGGGDAVAGHDDDGKEKERVVSSVID